MKLYCKNDVKNYMKDDWILSLLCEHQTEEEKEVRTHQWLMSMENKRMIYADLYGDLIRSKQDKSVLDIGGGLNSLTKLIKDNCTYTLLDIDAHGSGGN